MPRPRISGLGLRSSPPRPRRLHRRIFSCGERIISIGQRPTATEISSYRMLSPEPATLCSPLGRGPSASFNRNRYPARRRPSPSRSEEHTSELQSLAYLVCRLLLEKKKPKKKSTLPTRNKTL